MFSKQLLPLLLITLCASAVYSADTQMYPEGGKTRLDTLKDELYQAQSILVDLREQQTRLVADQDASDDLRKIVEEIEQCEIERDLIAHLLAEERNMSAGRFDFLGSGFSDATGDRAEGAVLL